MWTPELLIEFIADLIRTLLLEELVERGRRLPTLVNALRLGSILRTPVEFLFYSLNDALRQEIRAEEERLALPRQQVLF